jgi:hypothetical protein
MQLKPRLSVVVIMVIVSLQLPLTAEWRAPGGHGAIASPSKPVVRFTPSAGADEESLRRRDALLAKAQREIEAGIQVIAGRELGFGVKIIEAMIPGSTSALASAVPFSGAAELPEINSLIREANEAFLSGDTNTARKKWAQAGGKLARVGLEMGAELSGLEAIGLISLGVDQLVTIGKLGRLLFDEDAWNDPEIVGQELKRQRGVVLAERNRIKDALTSEVSGTSFDPLTLTPTAQANRTQTEKIVAEQTLTRPRQIDARRLQAIDRARREEYEVGGALLTEQWRVATSDETVREARERLNQVSRSVVDESASGRLRIPADQLRRAIPAGWVPCECPATHPNAGLLIDGQRWHTSALNCSIRF